MIINENQRYLLSVIERFGAIYETQALYFLNQRYPLLSARGAIDVLIVGRRIRKENGCLLLPGGKADKTLLTALDLMLLLKGDPTEPFFPATEPLALTFFKTKDGRLLRYDVCPVPAGRETQVCAQLEGIGPGSRKLVFLLETAEQTRMLWAPCAYCFAVCKEDKTEFYKVEGTDYEF